LRMELYGTDLRRRISDLAYDLLGTDGLVAPTETEYRAYAPPSPGAWTSRMMGALGVAIAGGASNIQRNIIGERGLGLPKQRAANMGTRKG